MHAHKLFMTNQFAIFDRKKSHFLARKFSIREAKIILSATEAWLQKQIAIIAALKERKMWKYIVNTNIFYIPN